MLPFNFRLPTKVIFAEDSAKTVPELIKELGGTKTLIITDENIRAKGLLDDILLAFKKSDLAVPKIFDQVPPDSNEIAVESATKLGADNACDVILAVGGGSVIDTAKVANICMSYGVNMLDYQGMNNLPTKLMPLIVVPTTAGTGSEVSLIATVKDVSEHKKLLFGSVYLAPDIAVLDPKLILSLPPKLTASTGMDALTHAIESFTALLSASPMSEALCLESMRLIFANLERATKYGADIEARSATLVASTMAGIAFTNTGVGLVHAMAHAIGARYHTHHGMTNAVFLPYVMEFNLDVAKQRYAICSRRLGITKVADDELASREFIEAVRMLIVSLGLPTKLKDLGVPKMDKKAMMELAQQAVADPAIMFNPKESSEDDIIRIYKEAY